ncbi:MAG TPA: glycosyl hydrolase [Microscillaceae bacterium]|nr:glycosyl hydrolase [Microscillaceae bacterium]
MKIARFLWLGLCCLLTIPSFSQNTQVKSSTVAGLKFRNIGPALFSGRVIDLAVNPNNFSEYYVAAASGGIWKTTNAGTTWKPIFDRYGSYSIGCITIDPNNPNVLWVGTGENNAQRSIAYGDGIYKSTNGGKTWKHVGLKTSEHIGKIVVDPRNSNVVYVAAQGPLWSTGGERGLYKTEDGGKTWKAILKVSDKTGVSDLVMDPKNPDVLYATAWQRFRSVFSMLSGGPESGIHKSTDGGKTWRKIQNGIPGGELGRVALAISPVDNHYVYAIVEGKPNNRGFYRSTNKGESWKKMSGYNSSGNYYQEIYCHPTELNTVYSMNTFAMVTYDGGRSFKRVGEDLKHVDNHAIWINPTNVNHMLIGCDGGLYETFDRAKTWLFKPNLPITQFYKVTTDNAKPFYNVYGGTQDNASFVGPSRTNNDMGIANSDWQISTFGDGFETQVDPKNENIVYAQSQYGGLVRFDKKSGERMGIKPLAGRGEPGLRWNWDAPLLISPHANKTLYFAANKLFKSTDRGNSWKAISPDLTRQLDRNKMKMMGRVWSVDAIRKNTSTSIFGNITALHESPKKAGVLYVGTDDGLVQISEDDGGNWRKVEKFAGVPDMTYVNALLASQHDENVVYAVFNNHKRGDFKPYLFKSTDKGKSWKSIAANLPARGSVYCIAEDHVDANLLFVGTEFGAFFTNDGGKRWVQLKAGLPTIAIRDMEIHKGENDLVLASFGRGFYILDNYTPLRQTNQQLLAKDAHIFPVKDALLYHVATPLGIRKTGFQGHNFYAAPNPAFGATFTYYVKKSLKTRRQKRQAAEAKARKSKQDIKYPSFAEMRAEDDEIKPYLLFTITDESGNVIRRMKTSARAGIKRIAWDLRFPAIEPTRLTPYPTLDYYQAPPKGHFVAPGTYKVTLGKVVDGEYSEMVPAQSFKVVPLNNTTLPVTNRAEVMAFHRKLSKLRRALSSSNNLRRELQNKVRHMRVAVINAPNVPIKTLEDIRKVDKQLRSINRTLNGDYSLSRRQFETPPSVAGRIGMVNYQLSNTTAPPTKTHQQNVKIAEEDFAKVFTQLKKIVNEDIKRIEKALENAGAPYTPGRMPQWVKD